MENNIDNYNQEQLLNGYSVISNKVIFDKRIKEEFRLYVMIGSLAMNKGYCNASNKYFSKMLKYTEHSINQKLKKLQALGYIDIIEICNEEEQENERKIKIK